MKWKILLRILAAIVLAFQFQFLAGLIPEETKPVYATQEYAEVTLYYKIDVGGAAGAPADFIVTRVSDTEVRIDWTKGENAENTTIVMKVNALPENVYDGYEIYTGNLTTFTDTSLDLDVIWSEVYYAAWSVNTSGGYSAAYVYDTTESPYVEEVANNLSFLGDLSTAVAGFVYLLALVVISALAFWKENHILFILAFGFSTVTALNAPDIISGNSETTSMGITVAAILLIYSLFCAAMAFRLIFYHSAREKEDGA